MHLISRGILTWSEGPGLLPLLISTMVQLLSKWWGGESSEGGGNNKSCRGGWREQLKLFTPPFISLLTSESSSPRKSEEDGFH